MVTSATAPAGNAFTAAAVSATAIQLSPGPAVQAGRSSRTKLTLQAPPPHGHGLKSAPRRMGRIDEPVETFGLEISRQPVDTAKAALAHLTGRQLRISRHPGQRVTT